MTIADGATVTLLDASIHPGGPQDGYGSFDGLTCEGDATIILEGSNTVNSVNAGYPAIYAHYGKTLTIKGTGSLVANGSIMGAGIGSGGSDVPFGNIVIESGRIIATSGNGAAAIGSGGSEGDATSYFGGNITINGGIVVASSGEGGAAIGSGRRTRCGSRSAAAG